MEPASHVSPPYYFGHVVVVVVISCLWIVCEAVFALVFFFYLIPRANLPTSTQEADHRLMLRVLERMKRTKKKHRSLREEVINFFIQWQHPSTLTEVVTSSNDDNIDRTPELTDIREWSPHNSDMEDSDADGEVEEDEKMIYKEVIGTDDTIQSLPTKYDVDCFLSWALFGKHVHELNVRELKELECCHKIIHKECDVTFPAHDSFEKRTKARCMSLEPVNATYRPLLMYLIVILTKWVGHIVLLCCGFRRHVSSSTGLVAWYRRRTKSNSCTMPMLFFHGIAPAGVTVYLPMVLWGLLANDENDDRPVLLLENHSIAYCMNFTPLTEFQTVNGVEEILRNLGFHGDRTENDDDRTTTGLCLVGHSFGSCPITWLLNARKDDDDDDRFPYPIRQVVLLDPVTILLSEPDVVSNFLYSYEYPETKREWIATIASSQLFTEYYLRRHFTWHRCELWLEDVLGKGNVDRTSVIVALSEHDNIVNTEKVKREVMYQFGSSSSQGVSQHRLIHWDGAGHGSCVISSHKWRAIQSAMFEQAYQMEVHS